MDRLKISVERKEEKGKTSNARQTLSPHLNETLFLLTSFPLFCDLRLWVFSMCSLRKRSGEKTRFPNKTNHRADEEDEMEEEDDEEYYDKRHSTASNGKRAREAR